MWIASNLKQILCLSLAVVSHAQGPWSKLNSRHLHLTDLGVKHYPAGMHRSRYEGSKLTTTGAIIHSLSTHYPLVIHSSSTYHPLIHHWFVQDLCLVALMIERWRCCHTADLCHRGSWFHFCILEMPRHLKDMKRKSSIDCSNWWRIWNFHEFPIAFETLPSLNSVEVCEAGAGGQQERTRTWQEREAHSAIHDQPVTPSFFPMGWTRRRTHGKCCCQMMI
jgi:hypothetical protein